ncbi:MAG: hypothetical protein JNN07_01320 [Verrucomicrobiales bacterium]|nr:hypothetical protein [Verrucomicrobiales bacterium]
MAYRVFHAPIGLIARLCWISLVLHHADVQCFAAPPSAHTRWSNPKPHGNQVFGLTYSDALQRGLQVTERGLIYYSDDLVTWIPRETGTNLALRAALFLPTGRAVLVGESGSVYYSDNLNGPQSIQPGTHLDGPTEDWLEGVAASPQQIVAVGDAGAIYTSNDGVRWKRQSTPFSTWLTGVAHGPAGFVAVGQQGTVLQSQQGTNWVSRSVGTKDWLGITYGGGRYLAVGRAGTIGSSSNGINWSLESSGRTNDLWTASANASSRLVGGSFDLLISETNGPWVDQFILSNYPAPAGTYYASMARSNYFLAAGRSGLMVEGYQPLAGFPYSWLETSESLRPWLWSATRLNDLYVAVGQNGTLLTSSEGVDWTLELAPRSVTNVTLLGVGGDSNLLVAVGTKGSIIRSPNLLTNLPSQSGNGTNLSSTFGVIWLESENKPTTNQLQGITAGHGLYVAVGDQGEIVVSSNGSLWTRRNPVNANLLSSVTTTPDGFIACGQKGTLIAGGANGLGWRRITSPTTAWLFRVREHDGTRVAVGEGGTLLTSTNDSAWVARVSGTTEFLTDVAWAGDACFILGQSGTLRWSTNYASWKELNTYTYRDLYGLATDGRQLIMVGEEGAILRSSVVSDTTPVEILAYSRTLSPTGELWNHLFLFGGHVDQGFNLEWSQTLFPDTWTPLSYLEMSQGSGTLTYLFTQPATNAAPQAYYRTRLRGE